MFRNVISSTGPKVRPEAVAASGRFLTARVLVKISHFLKGLSSKSFQESVVLHCIHKARIKVSMKTLLEA